MKKLITSIEVLLEHYTKETGLKITDIELTKHVFTSMKGETERVDYAVSLSCEK